MAEELPYTLFSLGPAQLHQLHTANLVPCPQSPHGKFFVMAEVAQQLFQETPAAFAKDLRAGHYVKMVSDAPAIVATVEALDIPHESGFSGRADAQGIVLLPPETVEQLLSDRRKTHLVQPFRLALLKLASQEAARFMANGHYEAALPIALDAVRQGQALFQPAPALQLFPLYLLAAQAHLGLKRAKPCEEFLGLASWLALKEPEAATHVMRSQLSRLMGQLHALQGRRQEALAAFADDVYHCSLEYGAEDVRTSLGFYNLAKVFHVLGNTEESMACSGLVVRIWLTTLLQLVLHVDVATAESVAAKAEPGSAAAGSGGGANAAAMAEIPLGRAQLLEVADMLADISSMRSSALGDTHTSIGGTHLAAALALVHVGVADRALEHVDRALAVFPATERDLLLHSQAVSKLAKEMLADETA
ncbi:hypothetical protein PPROV_000817600 [Pycnococcus provasolii]|uniref:Uncharacterized protein n=1 Tax=Pycnococcus provasolii TaxID=41880 RepID=A0A830HVH3_9CHLO|nr:hypothetical protein PPROV_000817600 [Pycnococcus provasolii]